MKLVKCYLEHEKARFMRHPIFWSVAIMVWILWLLGDEKPVSMFD